MLVKAFGEKKLFSSLWKQELQLYLVESTSQRFKVGKEANPGKAILIRFKLLPRLSSREKKFKIKLKPKKRREIYMKTFLR